MNSFVAKVVLFAAVAIENQWDDGGPSEDGQLILDGAEVAGLIHFRKPTSAELADDEWWGHEFEIDADTNGVGELTPEFSALKKEAMSVMASADQPSN